MAEQSKVSKPMSLADFAAASTDEFSVVLSRLAEAGTYIMRGESVEAGRQEPKTPEDDALLTITIKHTILQATPLNKERDPEEMVGKTLTERFVLWPKDYAACVGLLKGSYQKVGLPHEGAPGGIPEARGWLDKLVGWPYEVRVRHYTDKTGAERQAFDWKKADKGVFEAVGVPYPEDKGRGAKQKSAA